MKDSLMVPAREIPVPAHLSEQAKLALGQPLIELPPYPSIDDKAAWRAHVAMLDRGLTARLDGQTHSPAATVSKTLRSGVAIYDAVPHRAVAPRNVAFLYIHGGALICGGGDFARYLGADIAARIGARCWSVDYRMPPDHPYPAPLDDCVAAYQALIEEYDADRIIVGGGSAGANLAAATVLRARDEGLPLPGGLVLQSPELDLTESGDSFNTNMGIDSGIRQRLMPVNLLYAAGHDLAHPYLSPLFGDFTLGFPPTMISVGTRDVFLSNAARMHRALRHAGVPVELNLLEARPHGTLGGGPEDRDYEADVVDFSHRIWRS